MYTNHTQFEMGRVVSLDRSLQLGIIPRRLGAPYRILLVWGLVFSSWSLGGQSFVLAQIEQTYGKTTAMIPMRDGVKLYTEIYAPRESDDELPILFLRTPYRVAHPRGGYSWHLSSTFRELSKDNYIIALQDARGRHNSEGEFEWNRPVRHRRNPESIDASTDAFDSIEWLVTNIKDNNGRVGMLGVSYPGWYVTMALIDPHPALKAASPQASPSDYFIGDDFFHFGAFRLSPSAELPYLFDFDPKQNSRFPYDQVDTYEFFLDLGPLANMNKKYLHGVSPTWNHFMEHDSYDEFWQTGGTLQHFDELNVPTLNVVGWWDAENLGGALDLYDKLESLDRDQLNYLVVGPWAHGQWAGGPTDRLGEYSFGMPTVESYQRQVEARFFAHHLKGEGDLDFSEALTFQTGSNAWLRYEKWPPLAPEELTDIYLHAESRLSFDQPTFAGSQEYRSDPDKPVPFSARPIMGFWSGLSGSADPRFGSSGKLWKVEDQRFASGRPDVLTFMTAPLEGDVSVEGLIEVRLFASTSGTDCDWVVKLIDVYPEDYEAKRELGGYQLMIADDVIRAKFRESLSEPTPVEPNKVYEYAINLRSRNHRFRAGHRIMLQVQSSWFPLIDRNPQSFVDIPEAEESDFRESIQRVYFGGDYPSRVRLSILPR